MARLTLLAAAAALLAAPQVARAAEPACLTAREFTALSTYALPSVIDGTTRAWPEARAAFLKLSAARDAGAARLFTAMPDDALQQVADAALAGIVSGQVKPASCSSIDRVVALLSPLPAENTAELIALAAGLGAKTGEARLGTIALCKA